MYISKNGEYIYRWQFNEGLLDKKEHLEVMQKEIKEFLNRIGLEKLKIV